MKQKAISICPFIGAKDFELSRSFYRTVGFEETTLGESMSVFKKDAIAFYLQHAYVKDWIDNTMVFVEVENADACYDELLALNLPEKYKGARLTPVKKDYWGKE